MRRFVFALLSCIVSIAAASAASAQVVASRFALRGTILDFTGAPLAGAVITATSDVGRPAVSVVTDQTGAFTLLLDPGKYKVTTSSPGFQDAVREVTAVAGESVGVR